MRQSVLGGRWYKNWPVGGYLARGESSQVSISKFVSSHKNKEPTYSLYCRSVRGRF